MPEPQTAARQRVAGPPRPRRFKDAKRPEPERVDEDRRKGSALVNFLTSLAETGTFNGEKVHPDRIAAARAALPFLRPALASIEQVTIDARDAKDPAELARELAGILESNPALWDEVLRIRTESARNAAQQSGTALIAESKKAA